MSLECKGITPTRQRPDLMNAQRAINSRYFLLDVASSVSYGEKTDFPHVLPFILSFSRHAMHVEHCDWLNSVKVTSSGHFNYLSAGRSQLATFLRDRTTKTVSISLLILPS